MNRYKQAAEIIHLQDEAERMAAYGRNHDDRLVVWDQRHAATLARVARETYAKWTGRASD